MAETIRWIIENWEAIALIIGGLMAIANAITALTDTPKDDILVFKITTKIKAVLDRISVLTHSDAKGTLKLPLTKSKPQ